MFRPILPHVRFLTSPISGVISAGIGAIGSAASAAASKYAADKSYQAQIETNEMNYKINQENNSANAAMVDKQNEYNSAVNQRLRLEAAGMNPYMMMNGGSAGTSNVSVDGTQKPVQLDAPKLDYSNFANSLATAPMAAIDAFVKGGSALNQVKQSAATLDKTVKETKNTEARTELALAQKDNQLIQNDIVKATKDAAINQTYANLDQTLARTEGVVYDNAFKKMQNENYPDAIKASIAKDVASAFLATVQGKNIETLTPAQLELVMNQSLTEVAKRKNLDINTWRTKTLTPLDAAYISAGINNLKADTDRLKEQTRYIPKYYQMDNAKLQLGWYNANTDRQRYHLEEQFLPYRQFGATANGIGGILSSGVEGFTRGLKDANGGRAGKAAPSGSYPRTLNAPNTYSNYNY